MTQEQEKEVKDQEKEDKENGEEVSQGQRQIELPPVNFENFIFGMYNTAFIHLGVRDPETGELIRNLPLARHTIDTLGMIQEKTKGNLTAPEGNLLENLLYELRMNYLRAAKQAEDESKREPPETEGEAAESQKESEAQETADKQVEDESKKEPEPEGEAAESQKESEAQEMPDKDSC